ncbi:MAG: hypothetical protein FWE80_08470, partial [Oscillospiraceae bacterium]|nr:hypothetical protein [Oscillospiraceae bacterium]
LATALLPYAADLRVVTDSGRYAGAARQAQEHFGAMLRVGADRRRLHGVDWLAAPDGLQGLPLRGTCGTVSAVPCGTEDVIDGWLPREYNKWVSLTPKNIPPEQFLAGLYECSGMRELGALPEFVRCNGRYIQLSVISD